MYKDLRLPAKQADQRKEQSFQQACAGWLKHALCEADVPQIFYHVANERKASVRQMSLLKLQGVLSGVSDVVLPLKSGEYSGVYCELKTKVGCPSKNQKAFLNAVSEQGYLAVVINDFETFKDVFSYYIDNRTNR